jgi:glycine/D-amino acid oxidase-like deaminating enzyme
MLQIDQLSYWERDTYFTDSDIVIIGAGIVGLSTAIFISERYPKRRILIVEQGYLPSGASTKNAGFACFGSPSELEDDLKTISESAVWETFQLRYEGLKALFNLLDSTAIDYNPCGSWDLIQNEAPEIKSGFIDYLNQKAKEITGEDSIYSEDKQANNRFGFSGFRTSYYNRLEGSLNTGKLVDELYKHAIKKNIKVLFGVKCNSFFEQNDAIELQLNIGKIKTEQLIICSNGFAKELVNEDVIPARGQVLITNEIPNLQINGTFHFDKGYYYFRNVGNRILLGGGRNINFTQETSNKLEINETIQSALRTILAEQILPNTPHEIEMSWAGIMGVGNSKEPIIKRYSNRIAIGVRMGGMGVAIGTLVGKKLSHIID